MREIRGLHSLSEQKNPRRSWYYYKYFLFLIYFKQYLSHLFSNTSFYAYWTFSINNKFTFVIRNRYWTPNIVPKYNFVINVKFQILDVVTLQYCLRELEPRREELENDETRFVWCNRVQNIQPAMQVMTRLFNETLQGSHGGMQICSIGEVSMRIMNDCRYIWFLWTISCLYKKLCDNECNKAFALKAVVLMYSNNV